MDNALDKYMYRFGRGEDETKEITRKVRKYFFGDKPITDEELPQLFTVSISSIQIHFCENDFLSNKIVNKSQRMCGTISRTLKGKTQLSTQIKFYKVVAVPVQMYGSENWTLNRSDKRKLEAAEMRFLRSTAGYTLLNKKRSSDIREQLGIFSINDNLTQYKIIGGNIYKEWMTKDYPKQFKLQT